MRVPPLHLSVSLYLSTFLCVCACMFRKKKTVAIELIVQHIRDFLNNRTRGDTESNAVFLLDTNASAAIKGRLPPVGNHSHHHIVHQIGEHSTANCSTASAVMHTPH